MTDTAICLSQGRESVAYAKQVTAMDVMMTVFFTSTLPLKSEPVSDIKQRDATAEANSNLYRCATSKIADIFPLLKKFWPEILRPNLEKQQEVFCEFPFSCSQWICRGFTSTVFDAQKKPSASASVAAQTQTAAQPALAAVAATAQKASDDPDHRFDPKPSSKDDPNHPNSRTYWDGERKEWVTPNADHPVWDRTK